MRLCLAVLLVLVAAPVSAQSPDDLQVQVAALQQQVAALTERLETLTRVEGRPDRIGYYGTADSLVGAHQGFIGDCRSTESAFWGTGYDDSGRRLKHFSLSAHCVDPTWGRFYAVARMNAAFADRTHPNRALLDDVSQRWWGNQGSCLFCTSDYQAPGTAIFKINGLLQLPLVGQAPAPRDGPPYAPTDPANCWEWLKFYDVTGAPRFVRVCS